MILKYRFSKGLALLAILLVLADLQLAWARDIEYKNSEVNINVTAGEPTEIQFSDNVAGGYKRERSALSITKRGESLIVFSAETLQPQGEAILVQLNDGRSYSIRVQQSSAESPRDAVVAIKDERGSRAAASEEEEPPYRDKRFEYAPPSTVSGLMREMILAGEFGKAQVQGYRASDIHKGEVLLNDGAVIAKIERIFVGPNLWGYVLEAENVLDQSQRLNPATFRLDGTRAISMTNWELSPKPYNIEEQLSGKDKTKIYVITKARSRK